MVQGTGRAQKGFCLGYMSVSLLGGELQQLRSYWTKRVYRQCSAEKMVGTTQGGEMSQGHETSGLQRSEGWAERSAAYIEKHHKISCVCSRSISGCGGDVNSRCLPVSLGVLVDRGTLTK